LPATRGGAKRACWMFPLDDRRVAHDEVDHDRLDPPEALTESLRLRQRARETVEHVAAHAVGTRDASEEHVEHEFVGHEPAGLHVALGLLAQRRLELQVLAEEVARGNVRQTPGGRQAHRLGPLSGARSAEQDDHEGSLHGVACASR